jgi:hypothetical protein
VALGVVVRGRFLLGGQPVRPGVARVLGLSLLAMMLSVLARIQLDDDTVATVLGTIGIVGIIATLAVETWAVRWWGSGGEPASTSVEGSGPRG